MKIQHEVWAEENEKTLEWVKEKLGEGFHIHHIDGVPTNNEPDNLLLIWGTDHLKKIHRLPKQFLHGGGAKGGGRKKGSKHILPVLRCKDKGFTQSETMRELGLSLATVKRYWNALDNEDYVGQSKTESLT